MISFLTIPSDLPEYPSSFFHVKTCSVNCWILTLPPLFVTGARFSPKEGPKKKGTENRVREKAPFPVPPFWPKNTGARFGPKEGPKKGTENRVREKAPFPVPPFGPKTVKEAS